MRKGSAEATVKIFLVFAFFGLFTLGADAQDLSNKISWFVDASVFFFPEDNGMNSDPMPILPSPGFGVSFKTANIFKGVGELKLELALDFYFTHYAYDYTLDRAVPAAIENRSALVIGFPFSFQVAAYFNVGSFITLRVFGGPAADLRIVLIAEDLADADLADASAQTDSVRNYFWSSGRWFMPVIGTGIDFKINPQFKLGIDFRVWFPVYRLWSGEDLPAIEGWRFGPGIRLTIR